MRRITRIIMVGAVFLLTLGACVEAPVTGVQLATVTMRFLTPATVRTVIVEVNGPGIDPLLVNFAVGSDTTATGTLTLPAGSARRFIVRAVDTAGVLTHRADTTITLLPGANPNLAIRLQPLASTLGITVTFAGVRLVIPDTSTRSIFLGDTALIQAYALRANGDTVPADSLIWGTLNPAVVGVSAGTVTSRRSGSTRISVSYRGAATSLPVTVSRFTALRLEQGVPGYTRVIQPGQALTPGTYIASAEYVLSPLRGSTSLTGGDTFEFECTDGSTLRATEQVYSPGGLVATFIVPAPQTCGLQLSVFTQPVVVLRRISLVPSAGGSELLRNTDFAEGLTGWVGAFVEAISASPRWVASVEIPAVDTVLAVGSTRQLSATLRGIAGEVLAGRQPMMWISSNPAILSVSGTGLVTALAVGEATITAVSEGFTASVVMQGQP